MAVFLINNRATLPTEGGTVLFSLPHWGELLFCSEDSVSCVAKAWEDVVLIVEALVE